MAQKNDQGTAVWVNPGGTASFSYGGGGLTGIGAVYAMANPKGPGGQVMTTSQGLEGTNEAGGSTTSGSMSEPVPASAHVSPDASNLIHENLGSGSHPPSVSFPRCGSHPPVAVSDGAWTYRLAPILSPRTVWNGYPSQANAAPRCRGPLCWCHHIRPAIGWTTRKARTRACPCRHMAPGSRHRFPAGSMARTH